MELADLPGILRKRALYVIVAVLLAIGVAAYASFTAPRIYEASASVYFSLPYGQSASDLFQGSNYTQQQLSSYAVLAEKPIVLDRVIEELGLETTAEALASSVSAIASRDTVIIELRAASESPQRAAAIANAVAGSLAEVVRELSPTDANGTSVVTVAPIAQASAPTDPSSPNTRLNLVAGLLGGLFLGVSAAFARERLDTRVRDQSDLPEGLAVLGTIGFDKTVKESPVMANGTRSPLRSEAFRRLRTNLRFADVDNPVSVVALTSAVAGEGKSATSVNLALVLAEAGHRTLIVDADLRRPRVADYLGLVGSVGLADVLADRLDLATALQQGPVDALSVLTSGTIPPNPSELLGSHKMGSLMDRLRNDFDYVIIDTPPLLPVTDASVVAVYTDGVALVAGHAKTRQSQLDHALDSLHSVGARVLGVVFNLVPRGGAGDRNGYEYYYTDESRRLAGRRAPARGHRGAHRRPARSAGRPQPGAVAPGKE